MSCLVFTVVANKPAGTDVGRVALWLWEALNSDEMLSDLVKDDCLCNLASSYLIKFGAKKEESRIIFLISPCARGTVHERTSE